MSAAKNTDRELWREVPGDAFSPSIYATASGRIGICVKGHVIEKTVQGWHCDALATYPYSTPNQVWAALEVAISIEGSQKALAQKLGVSAQYLSDILRGRRDIPDKVARHFGLRRSHLFEPLPGAHNE